MKTSNLASSYLKNIENPVYQQIDQYPEKIIQFGTGVLLKGLPDFLIQKANEAGIFKGRIVLVKSTDRPGSSSEDNRFTVFENGVVNKQDHQDLHLVSSISREIHASKDWAKVLELGVSPHLEVVLSNTTEAGLVYIEEAISLETPPQSFPGKLTALLYARFLAKLQGLILIPCELIPENGQILKEIVLRQAKQNGLSEDFSQWLEKENHFCNSLVDRIVSGHPEKSRLEKIETELGFTPTNLIETEPYLLWAIECNETIQSRLGWKGVHPNWILQDDISVYRERKLRILNGTHTIMVGLGILRGFETVLDCMNDPEMSRFIEEVAIQEIAPSTHVDSSISGPFAYEVLDRFRNPHIRHILLNITLQYSMKMAMRNLPTLARYETIFGKSPVLMVKGFAAYLRFMNPTRFENGKWFGEMNGMTYEIQDDKANEFQELRQKPGFPGSVFTSKTLWNGFVFSEEFINSVSREYSSL